MSTITGPQLLEQLNWRYATKQFSNQKISATDWTTLEDALVLSASSGGLQPWAFVVVNDPAVREKLQHAAYGQAQLTDASHLVVFTARKNFSEADVDAHIAHTAKVRGQSEEFLAPFRGMLVGGIVKAKDPVTLDAWSARQTYIALGNLLDSAALLGIDACPMEGFDPAEFDKILGLENKGLFSTVICTLGYRIPSDPYAALAKVRFPKEKVIIHV